MGMTTFGQANPEIERKYVISEALKRLEENRAAIPATQLIREIKDLEARLAEGSVWTDSQSQITASFLNLWRDEDTNRAYLNYYDITRRLRTLKAYAATRLTPAQAQAAGVSQLQRVMRTETADKAVASEIDLSRPGGEIFETAKELPEPFTEEAVRRGGQAQKVGQEILTELTPVAEKQRAELEKRDLANTVLIGTSVGLLVLMKNKMLAGLLIMGLIYFFKKQAVEELKQDVDEVKKDIQNVRESFR